MNDHEMDRVNALRGGLARVLRRPPARLVVIVAVVATSYLLGQTSRPPAAPEPPHLSHSQAETAPETGEQRWYTCAMHPQVRSLDPKAKCPICGMDLIPVSGAEARAGEAAATRLNLSPRAAALAQVETVPVARRRVRTSLPLNGTVEVDETRLRHVTAWVAGRLERLFVDQVGMQVHAGEPMAEIYAPVLVAAQQELLASLAALDALPATATTSHRAGARALVAAAKDKLQLLGLRAAQVEEVVQRGAVADRVTLAAPVTGVVIDRMATQGMVVGVGDRLYTVADLSQVWAQLEAHEGEVAWVRQAQVVTLRVAAHPGEVWRGTVAFVYPVVEEATRTVRLRVQVPNPDGRLKPGMLVTGEVQSPVGEGEELVIPATAALLTGRRAVVYVQVAGGEQPTFEARQVELGARVGEEVVVRAGLAAGELVVVRGNFKIDSELQIRGQPSMMSEGRPGGAGHAHHGAAAALPAAAGSEVASAEVGTAPPPLAAAAAALLRGNFDLVRGLSDDDLRAAKGAARRLLAELTTVEKTPLPAATLDLWRPLVGRMRAGLERLAAAEELNDMRLRFEAFSEALTEAVRRFGTGGLEVYRAVCPMVQGRRGYWLQPQTTISNPYHGARMYSCGEIVETLGASPKGAATGGRR